MAEQTPCSARTSCMQSKTCVVRRSFLHFAVSVSIQTMMHAYRGSPCTRDLLSMHNLLPTAPAFDSPVA
eukprot:scaffold28411_cov20-Tisochrysis_lutea.AAC.3